MGPTCSIFFEREPVEKDIMLVYPRNRQDGLFRAHELLISIMQGLLIAGGVLILYFIFMKSGDTLPGTRTAVFITLIMSNIFLTFTNRSFSQTFAKTIYFKNNLVIPVTCISVAFLFILLFIPPVRNLFELSTISPNRFLICLATAFISVAWFEVYKMTLRRK
jgi:Ca2+-transporting ATPase